MNRTRRTLFATSLVAVTSLVFAACGSDDDGQAGSPDADSDADNGDDTSAEVTTITVWDRAGAEASARQAFFEGWNEEEGAELGIEVVYEPQSTDQYDEVLRLAFQTDRAPDVFHSVAGQVGQFVEAGWVVPLDDLVSSELLADAEPFIPENSQLVWNGQVYAVPSVGFTIRLFYNTDLFEAAGLDPSAPPTTFSEVYAAAEAITAAGDGEFYGIVAPTAWAGFQNWSMAAMVQATDPGLDANAYNYATQQYETRRVAPAIEMYRDLIANEIAHPGAEEMSIDTATAAIVEERAAMLIIGAMAVAEFDALGGAPEGLAVAPLPVPDGEELVWSPMNAGFPFSITTAAENPEAAAVVLEAIVGTPIQSELAEDGVPPLFAAAWDSPAIAAQPMLEAVRPDELDRQWPKAPAGLLAVEGLNFAEMVNRLVLDTSADIEAELIDYEQRYQAAFDQAVEQGTIEISEYGG